MTCLKHLTTKRFAIIPGVMIASLLAMSVQAAELSVWSPRAEMKAFYEEIARTFSEKYGEPVTINFLSASASEMQKKVIAGLSTGTAPDVFETSTILVLPFVESGVMGFNPPDVDAHVRANFPPEILVDYIYDGGSVGVPQSQETAVYFYNKDAFVEAGLDPDKTPNTYDELLDYAQKLTVRGADGALERSGVSLRVAGQGTGIAEKFRFVLFNYGTDLVVSSGDGTFKSGLNTDGGRAALKFYIDALYTHHVDDVNFVHDTEAFFSGKTAMFAREANVIRDIAKNNVAINYGTFPMPAGSDPSVHYTSGRTLGLYVGPNSTQSDLAWRFIEEATSPEGVAKQLEITGWLPVRTGVDYSPLIAVAPQWKAFVAPDENVRPMPWPKTAAFVEVLGKTSEELAKAFRNEALAGDDQAIGATIEQISNLIDNILKAEGIYGE